LISIGETRMKIRKAIRRTPMPLAVQRNIFLVLFIVILFYRLKSYSTEIYKLIMR